MSESLPNWDLGPRYVLKRRIGRGTYGQVCLAEDTTTSEIVAIKNLKGIFEDRLDSKRLLRETSILKNLNHVNIVSIRDIIIPGGISNMTFTSVFIVMESAQIDLKKLLRSPTFLDHDQVKFLLYQAVCSLRYMHTANVLHRDIKPANILINEDCTLKICDFGLSRSYSRMNQDMRRAREQLKEAGETIQINNQDIVDETNPTGRQKVKRELTGHVVTRWYRAPEVILLEKEYNNELDVWSLGCVFGEVLSMIRENAPHYIERGALFPGKSCFPLSPDVSTNSKRGGYPSSEEDQINIIFDLLGTPSEEDLEFITDMKALNYVSNFPPKEGKPLNTIFPGSTPEELEILSRMLTFNPQKRITLDELISNSYFDSVRDASREQVCEQTFDFVWDRNEDISVEELREIFRNEVLESYYQ